MRAKCRDQGREKKGRQTANDVNNIHQLKEEPERLIGNYRVFVHVVWVLSSSLEGENEAGWNWC